MLLGLLAVATAQVQSQDAGQGRQPARDEETWKQIAFQPPPALAGDLGQYRSEYAGSCDQRDRISGPAMV